MNEEVLSHWNCSAILMEKLSEILSAESVCKVKVPEGE